MMVDKYAVRKYVSEIIDSQYLIPIVDGPWKSFDDIDFEKLPDQFVLKCTHDSGGLVICRDKSKLDINKVRRKINRCLKRNYFYFSREWPYKNVLPRIIAEMYMEDKEEKELRDYKIFCFDGVPRLIEVDFDRFRDHKRNLYTVDWEYVDAQIQYPTHPEIKISRPGALEEMLDIAAKLSKDIPHVRVDLYYVDQKIYFGELTFYHEAGTGIFTPPKFEVTMGRWINLPKEKVNAI